MKALMQAALAAGLILGVCQGADARGFGAEANVARSYGQWGGELGLGYRLGFGIFDLTPAAGAFIYRGDSGGYFNTRDSNGTEHCRATNGQFADKDKCDRLDAKAYARVEAGVTIPMAVRLAVGARIISSNVRPYGAVSMPILPKLALKLNGGQHYLAGGVTFGF